MDEDQITLDPRVVLQFVENLDPKLYQLAISQATNQQLTEQVRALKAEATDTPDDPDTGGSAE